MPRRSPDVRRDHARARRPKWVARVSLAAVALLALVAGRPEDDDGASPYAIDRPAVAGGPAAETPLPATPAGIRREAARPEGGPEGSARRPPRPASRATGGRGPVEILGLGAEGLREIVGRGRDLAEVEAAVWSIGVSGELLAEDVPVLLARLDRARPGEDRLVRNLLFALSRAPEQVSIERLAELSRRHPSRDVRSSAIEFLLARGDEAAAGLLIEVALEDADPANRAKAAFLVGVLVPHAEAYRLACAALLDERDPEVRQAWVGLTSMAEFEGGRAVLERVVLDGQEDDAVRLAAAERLAAVDATRAADLVLDPAVPSAIRRRLADAELEAPGRAR